MFSALASLRFDIDMDLMINAKLRQCLVMLCVLGQGLKAMIVNPLVFDDRD